MPTQNPHTRTSHVDPAPPCAPGTRGWCIATACRLEASAPKPGNVHPAVSYPDLAYAELVAAGAAIAPAFDAAPTRRLGTTIRAAVSASRRVTRSNANLGIVLATAPLATVPAGTALTPAAVRVVLGGLVPDDAHDCWAAIAEARPGGMGSRETWDIAGAPPADLLAAMHAAADRDQIARLWAQGYEPLFAGPVADLDRELLEGHDLGDAIVRTFLRQLAREPDTLIARKHGAAAAAAVSARARSIIARGDGSWRDAASALEHDLHAGLGLGDRAPPARRVGPGAINPGTTADLVAAALYVMLVTNRLQSLVGPSPTLRCRAAAGAP